MLPDAARDESRVSDDSRSSGGEAGSALLSKLYFAPSAAAVVVVVPGDGWEVAVPLAPKEALYCEADEGASTPFGLCIRAKLEAKKGDTALLLFWPDWPNWPDTRAAAIMSANEGSARLEERLARVAATTRDFGDLARLSAMHGAFPE